MKNPPGKYAWTVKVGEKGQFVIPKEARDVFNIKPGDTILVLADEKKGIAIPPKSKFASLFAKIFSSVADDSSDDDTTDSNFAEIAAESSPKYSEDS